MHKDGANHRYSDGWPIDNDGNLNNKYLLIKELLLLASAWVVMRKGVVYCQYYTSVLNDNKC